MLDTEARERLQHAVDGKPDKRSVTVRREDLRAALAEKVVDTTRGILLTWPWDALVILSFMAGSAGVGWLLHS